jgi:tungstate transport system substrate-binding protein
LVLAGAIFSLLSKSDRPSVQGLLRELVLATTTSTYDSGLLDELNRAFEERMGVRVKVLAVGTGAALRYGREGMADVVLVHARRAEDRFLEEGWGINRRDVMANDFVIIGPWEDPAGIAGSMSAEEAFTKIAEAHALFLSRGDGSGTELKEREIWERAGIAPGGEWYLTVGKGMGDTIIQADRMGAYTLSDRGTFIALRDKIGLTVLVEGPLKGGDPLLVNPYGIIAVNPARHPRVNYELAMAYIGFLTSPRGQEIIADFKKDGEQLFYPAALSEEPNFAQYLPQGWRP